MGISALQQAALEIREEFKAGDHVVFGAHVDENLGDRVQVIVLGATDLEAGAKADVAPVADQVMMATPSAKAKAKESRKIRGRKKDPVDQNTFDFMEQENQRGIFDDLSSRNLYEGEDLDVPAYLRRGVKIAL